MKRLMILCLSAVTAALPQGYNYQHPGGSSNIQAFSTSPLNGFAAGSNGKSPANSGNSFLATSFGGSPSGPTALEEVPIVSKHFYLHSAPDEDEEAIEKTVSLGPPQKNYKVVFIKAPAPAGSAARISFAPPQNEEKTVIYVLSKKADADDIQTDVKANPVEPSKPEVFFIKYKTPEEAAHAQQQIQAQYDALGGSSHFSDEGVAPVSSVIGSYGPGSSQREQVSAPSAGGVNNNYLPPN